MSTTQATNILADASMKVRSTTERSVRTIVIASGKGGVGKTQLAVNLAVTLGTRGRHVLLVDGNPGLGDAGVALNITPQHGIEKVLKRLSVEEIMSRGPANVCLVEASRVFGDVAGLQPWERERVVRELASAAVENFDYIIIDTAAGVHAAEHWLTLSPPEVVIVTTPEPASLADAYATLKTRAADAEEPGRFSIAVNMSGPLEATRIYKAIAQTAQRFLKIVPAFLGYVPLDDAVRTASMRREPFVLEYADCPAARAVWIIAARLEHEQVVSRSFT